MIILWNPFYSSQNINTDSQYTFGSAVIREIVKQRPDWYFLIPFPFNKEFTYYKDGFFDLKNVQRIPQFTLPGKRFSNINFESKFWRDLFNEYPADIIINHNVEIGHLIKGFLTGYQESAKPMVINHHHYPLHPSLPYPMIEWEHFQLAQMAGAVEGDLNLFHSGWAKKMMEDIFDIWKWSNGKQLMLNKTRQLTGLGIIDPEQFEKNRQPKYELPTIIWNHRLQNYKGWNEAFEIFNELYNEGYKFKVVVTYHTGDNVNVVNKYPFVEVKRLNTKEEYLRELSKCHINVTNSSHESFCISLIESMYYGHICLAPKGVTFPELLGEDYKYLFTNLKEEKAMLAGIISSITNGTHGTTADYLTKRAIERYSIQNFAREYIDIIEYALKQTPKQTEGMKDNTKKAFREWVSTNKVFQIRDFSNWLQREYGIGQQAMSSSRLMNIFRELGYKSVLRNNKVYIEV